MTPSPASHDDALRGFEALLRKDDEEPVRPDGRSTLLTHGSKTTKSFVLLHGLSNGPQQFHALGQQLFEAGANVIIPRARTAGFANVMTSAQAGFRAGDLITQAEMGLSIARGLGERVTLAGLSAGGVSCAWVAQNHEDIDGIVLFAPFFAIHGMPLWASDLLGKLMCLCPNFFRWWDPVKKQHVIGPAYAYPRFSTRAVGEILKLASAVRQFAEREPIKCRRVVLITTQGDVSANNNVSRSILTAWRMRNLKAFREVEFATSENVAHDFIDPCQKDEQTARIYPILIKILLDME